MTITPKAITDAKQVIENEAFQMLSEIIDGILMERYSLSNTCVDIETKEISLNGNISSRLADMIKDNYGKAGWCVAGTPTYLRFQPRVG